MLAPLRENFYLTETERQKQTKITEQKKEKEFIILSLRWKLTWKSYKSYNRTFIRYSYIFRCVISNSAECKFLKSTFRAITHTLHTHISPNDVQLFQLLFFFSFCMAKIVSCVCNESSFLFSIKYRFSKYILFVVWVWCIT